MYNVTELFFRSPLFMVPYCTVNLVRKHMVLKCICKWVLKYSNSRERNCPCVFATLACHLKWLIYKLFTVSLACQNEGKKGIVHKFPMNILTWFKPTVELDTLIALMCRHYAKMSRREKMGDPEVMKDFSIPRKKWKEIHLLGMRVKASGLLSPCQIFWSFISKHNSIKQCLSMSASHNPNQNNVKGLKWQEEVPCTAHLYFLL